MAALEGPRDVAADAPLNANGSDAENADPAEPSLRKMFQTATEGIAKHRMDNLFQDDRTLTEEEQNIIDQRVAMQRRMFEEYERREKRRKVGELMEVCPDISQEEAERALELCDGREDDAASALVSDPAFRRRVKATCGTNVEEEAPAAPAPERPRREASSSRQPNWQAKPGPRPKLIDPASLNGNVFVGAFRGKGFKPPLKGRARKAPAAVQQAEEEEEEEEEEQQGSEQEEEEEVSELSKQPSETAAEEEEEQVDAVEQVLQQEQQQEQQQPLLPLQTAAAAAAGTSGGVLLWPGAQQGTAAPAEPQRYVLVQADTLQAPTDSVLRSARRQLGEPSDSRALGSEQDTPMSVARSRPVEEAAGEAATAAAAAGTIGVPEPATSGGDPAVRAMPSSAMLAAMSKQLARLDDAKARALLQRMPSDAVRAAVLEQLATQDAARAAACRALLGQPLQGKAEAGAGGASEAGSQGQASPAPKKQAAEETAEEEEEQQQPSSTGRGRRSRQAAVQARQAVKRAASAAASDTEATETEGEQASSSEEEEAAGQESSDDDFQKPSTRRARTAPARRARPTRAAKSAAAATLAAYGYAVDSDGSEGGDLAGADVAGADVASSSDDEQQRQQAQRQSRRRGAGKAAGAGGGRKTPAKKKQRVAGGEEAVVGATRSAAAAGAGAAAEEQGEAMEEDAASAGAPAALPATSQQQQQASGSEQQQTWRPSRRGSPDAAEASDGGGGRALQQQPQQPRVRAISSTGHTCRGRVRQKSHKSADLVEAGALRAEKGWYNAGYIFPEGFQSRTLFRSSVAIDQLCVHECHIIGRGGQHWPQPTFKVVALDRPDEPLIAKSCTGCWTGILKRINAEIEARRRAGEGLPPPPKTAIAGPEYFGLNQPNIQEAVEDLDPEELCIEYWAGKRERQAAAAGRPLAAAASRAARAPRLPSNGGGSRRAAVGGSGKGRRRRGDSDSEEEGEGGGEGDEDETQMMTSKWSAVSRTDRYRKRLQENGDDTSALDQDNPLPHFIDPITMGAVVRPAISPYGYVAGLATWKVMLSEKQQCPFTNQPLQFEQVKLLTKTNIHLHRDKIVNGKAG